MQQYRNNRNNGNFYDLRKDLQHTPPPSQQKGSSGSADGRYGFNGEPLSFAPDRTANGTVRRTRTDNSIEFPSQPRRTEQSGTRRTSGQNRNRTAQRSRTAQPEQLRHGPQAAAAPFTGTEAAQDSGSGSAAALQKPASAPGTTAATRPGTAGKTQEAPPNPRCTEAAADAAAADGLCDPAGRDRRRCLPDHDHAV